MIRVLLLLFLAVSAAYGQFPLPTLVQGHGANGAAITLGANVTSGNVLIVSTSFFTGTFNSISDSLGTTFTQAATSTAGGVTSYVWVGSAPSSGADTITLSMTSPTFQNTAVSEFSNVTTTVDTSVTGGFSGSPATITTSNITTNVGQDLLYAMFGGFRNACGMSPGSGYLWISFSNGSDCLLAETKISGANGTYAASAAEGGNDQGNYILIALKPSSALAIADTSLPNTALSSDYSFTLTATGGTGSYTWSITSGSLPSGLSLSSGGVISGTTSGAGIGTNTATFQVTDGSSNTATKTLDLNMSSTLATITEVQAASVSNAQSKAFASNVTAGNLLVVSSASNTRGLPHPTDTRGTIYRLMARWFGVQNGVFCIWAGVAPSSGANTVTVTLPNGGENLVIAEFSGVQLYYDNFAEVAFGTAASSTQSSNTLTTLVPNELVYTAAFTFAVSSSSTLSAPFTTDGATSSVPGGGLTAGYNVVTTATGYTSSFSIVQASNPWAIAIFGFRPGSTPPFLPNSFPVINNPIITKNKSSRQPRSRGRAPFLPVVLNIGGAACCPRSGGNGELRRRNGTPRRRGSECLTFRLRGC